MHTNFSKIALLYPKGDTRPSHEDLPKCAKLGVEIHIYTNIDTRTHTPQHFLKWNYISSYTKKYIYCMRCFSLLFDDTCFSIMLLKDKKKKNYSGSICYEEPTFGCWTLLFPEVILAGNVWVTSEGHKISINFRMSALSAAYSRTHHSKWQLWLKVDHLSGLSLTFTMFTGQRCTENLSASNASSGKSPPLSPNSHPLFSDMDRLCFKSSSFFRGSLAC